MKFLKYFLLFYMVFSFGITSGQTPIMFQHTYGNFDFNYGMCVKQDADSGYVILANVSGNNGHTNVYLFKIDKYGGYVWDKLFADTAIFWAQKMERTLEGGFIITGYTNKQSDMGYNIFVKKTDALGNKEWLRYYGGNDWDFGMDVTADTNGNYYVTGATYSYGIGESDVYTLKLNGLGDTLWTKTFGGADDESGESIIVCQNGDIVVAGYTNSIGAGGTDALLLRYDINGNLLWHKTYGGIENDKAFAVKERHNGSLVFGGITASFGGGGDDFYLVNTDSNGQLIWYETMGAWDDERAYTIDITADSSIVLAGTTSGPGYHDIYFYKTDTAGQWHYSTSHGMSMYENHAQHIIQTLDGGYIIVGHTNGYGVNLYNILVIKTTYSGLSAPYNNIDNKNSTPSSIHSFPNPFKYSTQINFSKNTGTAYELIVLNTYGAIVRFETIPQNTSEYIFNREDLPAGFYFYRLMDGTNNAFTGKFIVY